MEFYKANEERYTGKTFRRCGCSGIMLPPISLGFWHNFGSVDVFDHFIRIAHAAFDHGITHFDLANNYGPAYGSAEENFGRILKKRSVRLQGRTDYIYESRIRYVAGSVW